MKNGRRVSTLVAGRCGVMATLLLLPQPCRADAPHPSDTDIHEKLADILARPGFRPGQRGNLLLRALEPLADLLGWLGGLRATNPLLYWTLVVACSVLLLLLATHLIWTLRRILIAGTGAPGLEKGEEKRKRLSGSCWEEARRCAATGDFTEAIRFLFLSLVYRFDESGQVLFQQSATNREYLSLFGDRPQLQAELKLFVDTLDANWYGQHATEEQQYRQCLGLYERMKTD
jgi:hypothetical protein